MTTAGELDPFPPAPPVRFEDACDSSAALDVRDNSLRVSDVKSRRELSYSAIRSLTTRRSLAPQRTSALAV